MSEWRSDIPERKKEYRVGIVAAEFNNEQVEALLGNTLSGLDLCGISEKNIEVMRVPGSFELPLTALKMAETGNFDGIIVLGVVIRGDTIHFELVAEAVAKGVMDVNIQSKIPVIFGVLACENTDQVDDRIELGTEFAKSAVKMMNNSITNYK